MIPYIIFIILNISNEILWQATNLKCRITFKYRLHKDKYFFGFWQKYPKDTEEALYDSNIHLHHCWAATIYPLPAWKTGALHLRISSYLYIQQRTIHQETNVPGRWATWRRSDTKARESWYAGPNFRRCLTLCHYSFAISPRARLFKKPSSVYIKKDRMANNRSAVTCNWRIIARQV